MTSRILGAVLVGLSTFVGIMVATDNPTMGIIIAVTGGWFAGVTAND